MKMIKMNSIEECMNLIALLKHILEFYGDNKNYIDLSGNRSLIKIDEYGSQARFALNKIKELEEEYKKIDEVYISTIKNQNIESDAVLEKIKNINNI